MGCVRGFAFMVGVRIGSGYVCVHGFCWWLGLVRLKPGLAWRCYRRLLLVMAVMWVFLLVVTEFSCGFFCGGVRGFFFVGLLNFCFFFCVILVGF